MLPASRIEAVIEIIAEIAASERPAEAVVSAWLRGRRFIGSKDRAAINTRAYRIIRTYHRYCWWIRRSGAEINARNLVIADLMFEREHSPASMENTFSGERFAPEPLSAEELKLVKALDRQNLMHPHLSLREKAECPEWAFESLQRSLGDNFAAEMEAMHAPALMDIRVNVIKATRDNVLAKLKKDGFDVAAGKLSPYAIRVEGRPQLSQHEFYKDGTIEFQDEGSQMIAVFADARPGTQVADYCAGAGGKTLALAAAMNNKGRIVALDVLGNRLEKAKLRFRRAGVHNIETHALGEAGDKWPKRHKNYFDLVLVDAPCTGSGTWRREPDRRWRQLGPKLEELLVLQREVLENAQRLVKPGGRLVYATCSLLADENEDQVAAFVKDHPEFSVSGDFLKLTPLQHGTDGFFAARLEKAAPATKLTETAS